jgi:hypothetical protein
MLSVAIHVSLRVDLVIGAVGVYVRAGRAISGAVVELKIVRSVRHRSLIYVTQSAVFGAQRPLYSELSWTEERPRSISSMSLPETEDTRVRQEHATVQGLARYLALTSYHKYSEHNGRSPGLRLPSAIDHA